jgi:hypothetical protein
MPLKPALEQGQHGAQRHDATKHVDHRVGGGAQHRVVRREVPDRGDVRRRLQRVGRDEVVVLEEVAAQLGREEDDRREDHQEHATPIMSCTV